MAASKSGVPVYADTASLSRLAKNLRQASPAVWRAYKVAVREAAEVLLADMKQRAAYSDRIPDSAHIQVTASGNVKIVFDAPNAAPIENKGRGFVRHQTFGHDPWTEKNSHPAFASPALEALGPQVALAIEAALTDAVARALEGGI